MKSCRVNFGSTHIIVSSDHDNFLAFVKKYFTADDCAPEEIFPSENHLSVVFSTRGSWSPRGRRIAREHVTTWLAEGIGLTKEGKFLFEDKEITGEISFGTTVRGIISFRPIILKDIANRILSNHLSLQERYFRLVTRGVIQQLLFMLEARSRGVEILSAASIVWQGKAYIFAGLPGSGKTTTVTHLATNLPGAKILAQNYVPLLSGTTWNFTEGLTPVVSGNFSVAGVFIVTHGNEFAVRTLESGTALASLLYVNHATAELPVHSRIGAAFLGKPEAGTITATQHVCALAKNVPVQMVVMDTQLRDFTDFFKKNYGASS